MIHRRGTALLLAGAGACALSACATPQYGIYPTPPPPGPVQAPEPAGSQTPPAMSPIPNPGDAGDPQPIRPRPSGTVSSSTLPPPTGAPVAVAPTRPVEPLPTATSRPSSYRVRPGDTLFSVARQFDLNPRALADANGMTFQTLLRTGQSIRIPGGTADLDQSPRVLAEAATPAPTPRPPVVTPPASTPGRPAVTPIIPSAPVPSGSDVATLGRGLFVWPLSGAVLSRFGATGVGQRNDGVNIGAAVGAPVRASAAGEVAYTGNSVPGFGNLVLIRHPGGWVTAYGHLATSTVRIRQTVAQGEEIGTAGQTGAVAAPQLHFEVRYAPNARDRARPIDPLSVLPPAAG